MSRWVKNHQVKRKSIWCIKKSIVAQTKLGFVCEKDQQLKPNFVLSQQSVLQKSVLSVSMASLARLSVMLSHEEHALLQVWSTVPKHFLTCFWLSMTWLTAGVAHLKTSDRWRLYGQIGPWEGTCFLISELFVCGWALHLCWGVPSTVGMSSVTGCRHTGALCCRCQGFGSAWSAPTVALFF